MIVLITGASKGIGRAIALKQQHTYRLVLHASSEKSLEETWGELIDTGNHAKLCADFSDPAELKNFCSELRKSFGADLYAVINNAGITLDKSLLFQPEADIDKLLQVNLKAPIMISKTAFKLFHTKEKGVIINISSCVGEMGNAFQCVYAATKAGLVGFTKSLAREAGALLQEHSIRAFSVSPGYIETGMTDKIPEADKIKYLQNIPAKRLGKPEEVAGVIAFLLSEDAGYMNGSEIKVNGGIA
jgi:NAD(P)-dependent dehydrogenase (short-subunit alcohol dehydrogenase family)